MEQTGTQTPAQEIPTVETKQKNQILSPQQVPSSETQTITQQTPAKSQPTTGTQTTAEVPVTLGVETTVNEGISTNSI